MAHGEERDTQTITPADVGTLKATEPAPIPIQYRCAGSKIAQSEEWLQERVASSLEKEKKGIYKLTDDQKSRFVEMLRDKAIYQFDLEGIFGRDSNGPYSRVTCGEDVGPLIAAVPEDGDLYEITCPKCGTKATLRRTPPATNEG